MTIKSISFDLDDTFWPLMPTIMEAEKNSRNWIKDIKLAKKNRLELMEWTIDNENIHKNPLYNEKLFYKYKFIKKKYKLKIHSVTCDFFMNEPFSISLTCNDFAFPDSAVACASIILGRSEAHPLKKVNNKNTAN